MVYTARKLLNLSSYLATLPIFVFVGAKVNILF